MTTRDITSPEARRTRSFVIVCLLLAAAANGVSGWIQGWPLMYATSGLLLLAAVVLVWRAKQREGSAARSEK